MCRFLTYRARVILLTWIMVCCAGVSWLTADVLVLRRGGRIDGKILKRPTGPEGYWVVKVADGAHLRLRSTDVGREIELSEAERKYQKLLASVPDSEKGHTALAQWCHQNRLRTERDFHWEQVLRIDPNHDLAREKLGYQRIRGKWMRPDDYMREQGYVKHGNVWRTPEQIEIEERQRRHELATKGMRKDILLWRSWFKGRRREEAERRFRELDTPLASAGVREVIKEEKDTDIRLFFVDVLAQLPGASATEGLIHTALQDGEPEIRLRAIEALSKRNDRRTVIDAFVGALASPSNTMIRRAGVALAHLGDREAILPLIGALETTHVSIEQPREQIRTSFGGSGNGNGMGGLSVGGGPKKINKRLQNRSVLDALVRITGKNYRYDEPEWRRWFMEEFSLSGDVNLRRDP